MHIALLGATGVVEQEILSVLEQRAFSGHLRRLTSRRQGGLVNPPYATDRYLFERLTDYC
jgi:aspartate-semialdehyde dehydrogenase